MTLIYRSIYLSVTWVQIFLQVEIAYHLGFTGQTNFISIKPYPQSELRLCVKILAIWVLLLSPLFAWAGGPFSIRPPASRAGIDPKAVTVIGCLSIICTKGKYIYEPALIGFRNGRVFLSVHDDDVYFKIRSMILNVLDMLEQRGLSSQADMQKVLQTVGEQTGMPVDVTNGAPCNPKPEPEHTFPLTVGTAFSDEVCLAEADSEQVDHSQAPISLGIIGVPITHPAKYL